MAFPTFDQLNAAMGGSPSKGASSSAPSELPSFEELNAAMNAPAPQAAGFWQKTGDAVAQGIRDVTDAPAEWLAGAADRAGATPYLQRAGQALGIAVPTQPQLAAQDRASKQAFDAQYGGQIYPEIVRGAAQAAVALPVMATAGNLAGAALRGGAAALGDTVAGNALSGADSILSGAAGKAESGAGGLIKRGVSRAAQGAAAGATYNALTGGSPVQGAEWGAAMVPAGAAAAKAAGVLARPMVSTVSNALTELSPKWAAEAASNKLAGALAADGLTPEQVVERMHEMGGNATPVDAASALLGGRAGGNFRNLAEVAANSPGEGQAVANQLLGARADSAPVRIDAAIKSATGATGNIHTEAADLMAERSAAARPLYAKALAGELFPDARLQQFLRDPVFQSGLSRGQEIARLESLAKGEPFNGAEYASLSSTPTQEVPSALVDSTGQPLGIASIPGKVPTVSMRAADAAKRGLDDLLESYRDPTSGRLALDQRGRALNDVRNSFVDYLDRANPDYAAARAAWAGPSSSLDALAMGRKALSNDAEVTAANVARMSPSDRQFFLSGVTRALQDKIAGAQDGADATRKVFGNDLIRNKLAAAFDDPQAFDQFRQQMENEAQFAATKNEVLRGSQTARRLAGQADQGDIYGPALTAGAHLMNGKLAPAAANAATAAGNFLTQAPGPRQLAAQSRLLFTQDPDAFAAAFARKSGMGARLRNRLLGQP